MDIGPELRVIQVEQPQADIVTGSDERSDMDCVAEVRRTTKRPAPTDRTQPTHFVPEGCDTLVGVDGLEPPTSSL